MIGNVGIGGGLHRYAMHCSDVREVAGEGEWTAKGQVEAKGVCAQGEWNGWGGMGKEEFGDGGVEWSGGRGRQRKVSSG